MHSASVHVANSSAARSRLQGGPAAAVTAALRWGWGGTSLLSCLQGGHPGLHRERLWRPADHVTSSAPCCCIQSGTIRLFAAAYTGQTLAGCQAQLACLACLHLLVSVLAGCSAAFKAWCCTGVTVLECVWQHASALLPANATQCPHTKLCSVHRSTPAGFARPCTCCKCVAVRHGIRQDAGHLLLAKAEKCCSVVLTASKHPV